MPIHISKNALFTNPIDTENINAQDPPKSPFSTVLFQNIAYLERLVRNDFTVQPLQKSSVIIGESGKAVRRIKMALNAIDNLTGNDFNLPEGRLNAAEMFFDEKLENAVKAFQAFAEIQVTGKVDGTTLKQLDGYLKGKEIFDYLNHKYLGVSIDKKINIVEQITVDNRYSYSIYLEVNGASIPVVTDDLLAVTPVIVNGEEIEGTLAITLDDELRRKIVLEGTEIPDEQTRGHVLLKTNVTKIAGINNTTKIINSANLDDELGITPPAYIKDRNAKLYKVKDGEDFVALIEREYYNGALEYKNPYDETAPPIFTFPSRQLAPVSEREHDARLQFYLNLIYYYNTNEVDENGNHKEYGIKAAANYTRYDIENLDSYFIFDNEFDPTNEATALPNYYRFIKAQEAHGTKIEFDAAGKTTTFEADPGKNIWLPSREFSEAWYYHLNFRHKEMLKTNDQGGFDYVEGDDLLQILALLLGLPIFGPLGIWLKTDTQKLYEETVEFFSSAYDFMIDTMTETWPRGLGGMFGVGIGITWGYPIATDVKTNKMLWRKMTDHKELTLIYKEEGEMYLGVDVAGGGSMAVNMGGGKSKGNSSGFKYGAGAKAGVRPKLSMEYEFPVRKEETALLSVFVAVFGGAVVRSVVGLLDLIGVINIDPRHYLTKMSIGFSIEREAWAAGQISIINTDNGTEVDSNKMITKEGAPDSAAQQTSRSSYFNVDNIWRTILSGVGVSGEISFMMGTEITYEAKYDDDPLIPEREGRVPSEVKTESLFFVKGKLNIGPIGDFLQQWLVGLTPAGWLIDLLNFDQGMSLTFSNVAKRPGAARDLTLDQLDVSNATPSNTNIIDVNGGVKYEGKVWERSLKLATYSGDVNQLCGNGTETSIKLNLYRLVQILSGNIAFSLSSIDDVISLVHSTGYRYKIGVGYASRARRKISDSVFNEFHSGVPDGDRFKFKSDIMSSASNRKYGFALGAGLDIGLEFVIPHNIAILKYFIKKYYVLGSLTLAQAKVFRESEGRKKVEIKRSLNEQKKKGSELYGILYDQLNTYLDSNYSAQLANANFTTGLKVFMNLYKQFVEYLNGVDSLEVKQFDVHELIEGLAFTAAMLNINVAMEAKLGVDGEVELKLGEGATVRGALNGALAFIDHTIIMEQGQFVQLSADDPLRSTFEKIKNQLSDSVTGVKQSILNVID